MTLDQAKIILDLGEKNNIDDIRKAYRKKALQYHPDRYQTFSEQAWATKKFIKIKEAYELLMSGISISNASSSEEDIHFESVEIKARKIETLTQSQTTLEGQNLENTKGVGYANKC